MRAWWYIWRLARFRPRLYLLSGLTASFIFYLIPLIPGLITRRFFDYLSRGAQADFGLWSLLALLVATAVGRAAGLVAGAVSENTLHLTAGALLRKNLLERILNRPGARSVPSVTTRSPLRSAGCGSAATRPWRSS